MDKTLVTFFRIFKQTRFFLSQCVYFISPLDILLETPSALLFFQLVFTVMVLATLTNEAII